MRHSEFGMLEQPYFYSPYCNVHHTRSLSAPLSFFSFAVAVAVAFGQATMVAAAGV